ncbi:MAG: MerR family transcriptional regulator [Acidimicrobiia bacterium]
MTGDGGARSGQLSIGEFARRCRLPVSTLRYYADIGLLLPASVDPRTGYRRYDRDQIDQAVLIGRLRVLGVGPGAIARIAAGGNDAATALEEERRRLQAEIGARTRAMAELDAISATTPPPRPGPVERVELPGDRVVTVPASAKDLGAVTHSVLRGIATLRRHLRGRGILWTDPFGARFPLDLTESPIDASVFVRCATGPSAGLIAADQLPTGPAAVTLHAGPPDGLARTYDALFEWIARSEVEAGGPVIEEYLSLGPTPHIRLTVPIAERTR